MTLTIVKRGNYVNSCLGVALRELTGSPFMRVGYSSAAVTVTLLFQFLC